MLQSKSATANFGQQMKAVLGSTTSGHRNNRPGKEQVTWSRPIKLPVDISFNQCAVRSRGGDCYSCCGDFFVQMAPLQSTSLTGECSTDPNHLWGQDAGTHSALLGQPVQETGTAVEKLQKLISAAFKAVLFLHFCLVSVFSLPLTKKS